MLRHTLAQYTEASSSARETVITLPGAGREIALNGVADLLNVTDVWWPYDSTADEVWPPNRVRGFRVWWDDGSPVLLLSSLVGNQPQLSDELRLWYTVPHTIQDLDSADSTTIPAAHVGHLSRAAAGYAAPLVANDKARTAIRHPLAELYITQFTALLDSLRTQPNGEAFNSGWSLDKWDTRDRTYS
jgi:hypothetical protein